MISLTAQEHITKTHTYDFDEDHQLVRVPTQLSVNGDKIYQWIAVADIERIHQALEARKPHVRGNQGTLTARTLELPVEPPPNLVSERGELLGNAASLDPSTRPR